MKIFSLPAALSLLMIGSAPAHADEEVTTNISCSSSSGIRQECPIQGEPQSARLMSLASDTPCIYGYSWGFTENGIWAGNGCAGMFQITSIVEQQTVDPRVLENRVVRLKERMDEMRLELEAEREAKRALEKQINGSAGKISNLALSIEACRRAVTTRARDTGVEGAGVRDIHSVRRRGKIFEVIGVVTQKQRDAGAFMCKADNGQVAELSFPL